MLSLDGALQSPQDAFSILTVRKPHYLYVKGLYNHANCNVPPIEHVINIWETSRHVRDVARLPRMRLSLPIESIIQTPNLLVKGTALEEAFPQTAAKPSVYRPQ